QCDEGLDVTAGADRQHGDPHPRESTFPGPILLRQAPPMLARRDVVSTARTTPGGVLSSSATCAALHRSLATLPGLPGRREAGAGRCSHPSSPLPQSAADRRRGGLNTGDEDVGGAGEEGRGT